MVIVLFFMAFNLTNLLSKYIDLIGGLKMKYLQDYMETKQTHTFDKYGVFFAFSRKQLTEGKQKLLNNGLLLENEKLTSFDSGMFCPSKNADIVFATLDTIHDEAIKQDIAENGIENIINRELGNYETQLSGDISSTVEALSDYGINEEQIQKYYKEVYFPLCVKNDWF